MKSGISANQLWTQQPVASRLVEVNTKTGFSLTAGSYIVRASSTQATVITVAAGGYTNTVTISSVTTTRAFPNFNGLSYNTNDTNPVNTFCRMELTNGTTITGARAGSPSPGNATMALMVIEFF